jgi:hypothetical protein
MKNKKRKFIEDPQISCKKIKISDKHFVNVKNKIPHINVDKFDKLQFVSPSQLKNYVLKDTIIDYLEYYKINNTKKKPYLKKKTIKLKKDTMKFEDFIKNKGVDYEKKVMNNLKKKYITISGLVNIESYNKTIDALNNKKTIIYQGVLFNEIDKTYGRPDLIIRGDILNKLYNQNEKIDQYYIIDIKFSSIKLSANKTYILNSEMIPTYKTQILLYTEALNKLLNQNVKKGFILAKKYLSESKGIKEVILNKNYNILAPINYESIDNKYYNILENAINWIFKLRKEGSEWKLLPKPSINELYPNMSNNKDGKWRSFKKELADNIKELTLLVNVGYEQRKNAFKNNIYSYTDKKCNSSNLGLYGKRGIIVDEIISINSPKCKDLIRPKKIKCSILDWRKLPNNQMEFYLDYETTTDFDELNFIFMIGVGYINKQNKWKFKCLVAKNKTLLAQIEMFKNFWNYINNVLIEYKKDDGIFIHWTSAEQTFFNKIKNIINCKEKIFLDLYQIFITEPIVIKNAFNYSLKTIAKSMFNHNMIKTDWDNNSSCINGLDALVIANQLYETKSLVKINDMKDIAYYNEIDCKVLYEILEYLRLNH